MLAFKVSTRLHSSCTILANSQRIVMTTTEELSVHFLFKPNINSKRKSAIVYSRALQLGRMGLWTAMHLLSARGLWLVSISITLWHIRPAESQQKQPERQQNANTESLRFWMKRKCFFIGYKHELSLRDARWGWKQNNSDTSLGWVLVWGSLSIGLRATGPALAAQALRSYRD